MIVNGDWLNSCAYFTPVYTSEISKTLLITIEA